MPNIHDAFPSNYLKSADLQGRVAKLKIANVTYEQIGTDNKLIMKFVGKEKGMVLNKTNAMTIAEAFGPDTDNWVGAEIEVFSMKVEFNGRMTDGLRLRIPIQRRQPPAQPTQTRVAPNARDDRQNALAAAHAPAMADAGGGPDPFDDDIPFAAEWR